MLSGYWTYRSFRNLTPLIAGDPKAALALVLDEGVLDLHHFDDGRVEGALGMETGDALRVTGRAETIGDALWFRLSGEGQDGAAPAGRRFDYRGIVCPAWSDAPEQAPSLAGTVRRVDGGGPDDGIASFIAVRHSDAPPRRTARPLSSLIR